MTHACCPDCRLRLILAVPTDAPSCPECHAPMVRAPAAESLGCRLVTTEPDFAATAAAAAMTVPVPPGAPS